MISRQAMLPRCFNPLCLLLSQPSARLPSPALHHYRKSAKRPQRKKAAGSSPAACISIFTESVQSVPNDPLPISVSRSYRKSRIRLLRTGFLSFLNAFASIWRIRSLVTLNSFPTSSRVLGCPSSRPNRRTMT